MSVNVCSKLALPRTLQLFFSSSSVYVAPTELQAYRVFSFVGGMSYVTGLTLRVREPTEKARLLTRWKLWESVIMQQSVLFTQFCKRKSREPAKCPLTAGFCFLFYFPQKITRIIIEFIVVLRVLINSKFIGRGTERWKGGIWEGEFVFIFAEGNSERKMPNP